MSLTDQAQEQGVQLGGKIATAVGSSGAVAFGFTGPEWQAIGIVSGIVIGLIGVVIQFVGVRDKRRQARKLPDVQVAE